jgi:hypothetical protein
MLKHDDAVKMIGHDHECIDIEARILLRQDLPLPVDQIAQFIETYCPVADFGKEAGTFMCTDRYEIHTDLSVVVVPQAQWFSSSIHLVHINWQNRSGRDESRPYASTVICV